MSDSLHLVRLKPDLKRLTAFAAARRVEDTDYALHQAMTETFGVVEERKGERLEKAGLGPKPFRLLENRRERDWDLLGYSSRDAAALRDLAVAWSKKSDPDAKHWDAASAAIGLVSLETRPMPDTWTSGRRYRFEVRARPVMRTSRAKEKGAPHERDVYLSAIAGLEYADFPDRRDVYRHWLAHQLSDLHGVEPVEIDILAMHRSVAHRPGSGRIRVEGPDVTFAGVLRVSDSARFSALLARGLGRHRAFGFGMLLLSPGG